MRHPLSRREFLSTSVAAATAAAVGLPGFSLADAAGTLDPMSAWKWDKGVCRFCGTGCGIQVGTRDDRVVAVKGDAGFTGEPRPALREGLRQRADPVRCRPPDHAAAPAHERRL
jgi:anaerobic selenocysteine-containing dehydrogenase